MKMIIKVMLLQEIIFKLSEIMGIGRRIAISTSKIKKIIPIMKNRRENGIRDKEKGSNPHSKGELFSRSSRLFFLVIEASRIIVADKATIKKRRRAKVPIIFSADRPSHWK
jgi:hypothetical protein